MQQRDLCEASLAKPSSGGNVARSPCESRSCGLSSCPGWSLDPQFLHCVAAPGSAARKECCVPLTSCSCCHDIAQCRHSGISTSAHFVAPQRSHPRSSACSWRGRMFRAAKTSHFVSRRAGRKDLTESHFPCIKTMPLRPIWRSVRGENLEDELYSRFEGLPGIVHVAQVLSVPVSWPDGRCRLRGSWDAGGAHVLENIPPIPSSLAGKDISGLSTVREGAKDAAGRNLLT
jgi:hypothetical protein